MAWISGCHRLKGYRSYSKNGWDQMNRGKIFIGTSDSFSANMSILYFKAFKGRFTAARFFICFTAFFFSILDKTNIR